MFVVDVDIGFAVMLRREIAGRGDVLLRATRMRILKDRTEQGESIALIVGAAFSNP